VFEYPNHRRAETLWFHDHALGITRLNVYAGLAGFFLIRDEAEDALGLPGPAPRADEPAGTAHYELPIAIQDRSFYQDGSLAYPAGRADFDGYEGPFIPATPVHPVWNPEVFGDTMVVNGNTWPYVEVEPRLYRLRILNGTNARTLRLSFDRPVTFHLIGIEGGLLSSHPVERDELLLGPAERADVLVDLSGYAVGDELILRNTGPDEPYQGPAANQSPADPDTTGQVMLLRIVPATSGGVRGAIPTALPAIEPMTTELPPRDLTLNERVYEAADIPVEAMLGTAERGALEWTEEATERPALGTTEIWRLLNLTADTHPIHLHLVMFQVLDRTPFDAEGYGAAQGSYLIGEGDAPRVEDYLTGPPEPAHPWENGFKDTVLAHPGELTRIVARFDIAGLYVWHCHILEHEDNEMMRPFEVMDVVEGPPGAPDSR
jgi:spore coat protein A, manganese oxidase